ncbi:MAG: hypothetical protein PCFJNLEI_03922 [Verrucomicrobiae bacterium]|nr:hypothetical protein [Verrucomicrobiae bacterium]
MNWIIGWWLILAGFLSGAVLGLFFHRDGFLGGYGSFQRRMLRLGHIACAALGMLNLIVGLSPVASLWLAVGSVTMPAVCFLTAWRKPFRHLFFVPVVSLVVGVIIMLSGGRDGARPSITLGGPRSVVAEKNDGGSK